MVSPCRNCDYRHLSKAVPFIWLSSPPRGAKKNRTPRFVSGEKVNNPCWCCEKAIDYADAVDANIVGPPSSWPDGTTEHPIDFVAAAGLRVE